MARAAGRRRFRALCTPSGASLALGTERDVALNCAGVALVRVFRGRASVWGFRPRLGVYVALHSPKWSDLLVLRAEGDGSGADAADDAFARFSSSTAELLRLTEPEIVATLFAEEQAAMDEEHAVDDLAAELAAEYPVVLIFRALPVTFGNVLSFFEPSGKTESADGRPGSASRQVPLVLPGFKMIIPKYNQPEWREAAEGWEKGNVPNAATALVNHAWKSPERVFSEFAVLDSLRVLQLTDAWQATADTIEKSLLQKDGAGGSQRIVVCGAKGVGKSTYCRYLVNRLLSHFPVIAFLDTDLGQSELTPPGMVSLHAIVSPLLGPGFTHMRKPLRSFFCGATNPGNDPLYYMRAVKSLLRLYESKAELSSVPLVVNTDGWIKSMGHDLLCHVIQESHPTHLVQLLAVTKNKQFGVPSEDGNGHSWQVHQVAPWDPTGTAQSARSAKEARLYRLHTYFLSRSVAARFGDVSGSPPSGIPRARLQNLHVLSEKNRLDKEIALAYAQLTPFAVSFDAVDISFSGSSVPPSQLLWSLNASIVGLCVNPSRSDPTQNDGDEKRPPRIVIGHVHAPCLGVGIVRAVDAARRLLFVLTPLPLDTVKRVNLLVRSNLSIDSLLLGGADAKPDTSAANVDALPGQTPYVVTDVVDPKGTGSAVMQSRNNIKRKRDK